MVWALEGWGLAADSLGVRRLAVDSLGVSVNFFLILANIPFILSNIFLDLLNIFLVLSDSCSECFHISYVLIKFAELSGLADNAK